MPILENNDYPYLQGIYYGLGTSLSSQTPFMQYIFSFYK